MADIVDDLADLHRQATHEPSHYYAAQTAERAIREIERLRAALEQGEYLAQAAIRAMRDHGGPEKFLDLNAAVARFREARADEQKSDT